MSILTRCSVRLVLEKHSLVMQSIGCWIRSCRIFKKKNSDVYASAPEKVRVESAGVSRTLTAQILELLQQLCIEAFDMYEVRIFCHLKLEEGQSFEMFKIAVAAVPLLCTVCPTFLIHFQPTFLKSLFSPVVPAVVPSRMCATHSLLFQWFRLYSL